MTALQDWLPISPRRRAANWAWTPRAIRALVRVPLRIVLPARPIPAERAPRLLKPGAERC